MLALLKLFLILAFLLLTSPDRRPRPGQGGAAWQTGARARPSGRTAIEILIDIVLLGFLTVTVLAVIRLRNLFAVVMLFGIYSFLAAALFVTLDAVDVAFTEAAVGAGISTFLMLSTLALTVRREKVRRQRTAIPLLVVTIIGATLVYGTLDMPHFSDPSAPLH